jgi:hypothetical protein
MVQDGRPAQIGCTDTELPPAVRIAERTVERPAQGESNRSQALRLNNGAAGVASEPGDLLQITGLPRRKSHQAVESAPLTRPGALSRERLIRSVEQVASAAEPEIGGVDPTRSGRWGVSVL